MRRILSLNDATTVMMTVDKLELTRPLDDMDVVPSEKNGQARAYASLFLCFTFINRVTHSRA